MGSRTRWLRAARERILPVESRGGARRQAPIEGTRSPGALLSDVPPRRALVHHWNLVLGVVATGLDGEGDERRYALALIVLYLLWLLPNFPDRLTTILEPLLMGVFVLHITMAFTLLFHFVPPGTLPGPVETVAVLVLTAALVALLRTTALGRRLL